MKIEINKLIENKEYCREIFNFFIKKEAIKKTDPALFEKHLNKSLNNLELGNFILSEHSYSIKKKLKGKSFYDWCIVIYYYAIYHSVLALISKAGFESKNHIASISALTYIYYHKKNLLNKEDIQTVIDNFNIKGEEIEFIASSKEIREKASYKVDENFGITLAEDMRKKTADFVNKIKLLLEGEFEEIIESFEKPSKNFQNSLRRTQRINSLIHSKSKILKSLKERENRGYSKSSIDKKEGKRDENNKK